MLAAITAFFGVILGTGLSYLLDLRKTSQRTAREDLVWRRQHILDASQSILMACESVRVNAMTVQGLRLRQSIAQASGDHATVQECRDGLPIYEADMKAASVAATNALSQLSILVPQRVILLGNALVMGNIKDPKNSANTTRMIELLDGIRHEVGMPARDIGETR